MAGTVQKKTSMPAAAEALPGRGIPMQVPERHFVNGHRIVPPFPAGMHAAVFTMGCGASVFWESRDPTQGMRQHGDIGTQYRSALYVLDSQQRAAVEESRRAYQEKLTAAHRGTITTEIAQAGQ